MVEPSPFSHVSGMKNRFLRLIENLVELGDDVVVVTPDRNAPATYHGAQVIGVSGLRTGTFQVHPRP
jgi:sulfoquinovosyltransferase